MRIIRSTVAITALLAGATACGSDNAGPNQSGDVGIGFRLEQTSGSSNLTAGFSAEDGSPVSVAAATAEPTPLGFLISRGDDELLITKAQIVIKNVKLKRTSASCSDDDDDDDRRSDRRDDGCPSIHVGPYLVDMAVSGVDGGRLSVDLPEGSYSAVRFDIHKVTSSRSDDLEFRQTHPDFRDISVRLEGTYNDTPFTFVSDVNAKLDVPLPEPLAIGGDIDNITVSIDVGSWFINTSGGLYSPALANTPGLIRARVDNNIRFAFKAFRDKNRDGRKD